MKRIILFSILALSSCSKQNKNVGETDEFKTSDTLQAPVAAQEDTVTLPKYSNERFREVTVQKVGDEKFRVKGQGQIFEASFSWIVEDGHNELIKGVETTDAGAPEWGKFDFTVEVAKKETNSTLILMLFELSARDGSRQHELPIPLH